MIRKRPEKLKERMEFYVFRVKECEEYAHILMIVGDETYCPVSSGGQKESGTDIGSIQE